MPPRACCSSSTSTPAIMTEARPGDEPLRAAWPELTATPAAVLAQEPEPPRLFGAQGEGGAAPDDYGRGSGGEQVARQDQCEQPEDEGGHRDLADRHGPERPREALPGQPAPGHAERASDSHRDQQRQCGLPGDD